MPSSPNDDKGLRQVEEGKYRCGRKRTLKLEGQTWKENVHQTNQFLNQDTKKFVEKLFLTIDFLNVVLMTFFTIDFLMMFWCHVDSE